MNPSISIIIPVKNAGPGFGETLAALFTQEGAPAFEVIVIDSGSTDGTLEVCRRFPVKLLQIDPSQFSHGGTRNLGASLAKGDFLVFLVQDATPVGKLWLRSLLEPLLENGRIAGAYSRHLPRPDASRRQAREIERYFATLNPLQDAPTDHTFSNVSSIIRKEIFDVIGFPPTDFGEDQLWARRVLSAGYLVQYQPHSVVLHSHQDAPRAAFRRGVQEGTLATAIHPEKRPASPFNTVLEALYESAKWALRCDLKSCRYSISMAAWHFGYRKGYASQARRDVMYVTESSGYGGAERYLIYLAGTMKDSADVSVALPFKKCNARFRAELAEAGIPTVDLPQFMAVYPINFLIALLFFVRRGTGIIHFSLPYPDSCRWLLLAAAFLRKSYVITEHLVPPNPFKAGTYFAVTHVLFNCLKKLSYRRSRGVAAVSRGNHDVLVKSYGMPQGKMTVIHNGVDCARYRSEAHDAARLKRELDLPEEGMVLTSIGRLAEQKGHRYLLDALLILAKEHPSLTLLLVGDGPLYPDLEQQAKENGIAGMVRFAGFREDIPAIFSVTDIFVMSSLNEGFPLTLLEAMAAGMPVVTTEVTGTAEAIVAGETGLLCAPASPEDLAEKLRMLINDRQRRLRMGQQAQEAALRDFDVSVMVEKTRRFYEGGPTCAGR